jgi:alkanesulfonate monooxygenase SsuD/methylene tetrahydromethanopterin reductase-like flavin-dependent oxidoreductase (luciferase family)
LQKIPGWNLQRKRSSARYDRYKRTFDELKATWGSLLKFADAHNYFGIHYDKARKGWVYREWAPKAQDLYFFGDFNNWQRYSHRMTRNQYGVWEIFLDKETYKGPFSPMEAGEGDGTFRPWLPGKDPGLYPAGGSGPGHP